MQIIENGDLKKANSLAAGAKARYLVILDHEDDLSRLKEERCTRDLPILILGGGSNVLFRNDFSGVVVVVRTRGIELLDGDRNHWYLRAAAGENWHGLVLWSLEKDLAGLENLSLIPGSVGAAPVQNIGAYGVELKDRFQALDAVALDDGGARTFTRDACEFGYRTSVFKARPHPQYLITSITLRLPRRPEYQVNYRGVKEALAAQPAEGLHAARVSQAICALRRAKLPDPKRLGNAGSFFKNPTLTSEQFDHLRCQHREVRAFPLADGGHKLSAAWLIESCGWKGYRRGDAGVYPNHALVLVNYGSATGQQIWQLAQDIAGSVAETFGIHLEPEVTIV